MASNDILGADRHFSGKLIKTEMANKSVLCSLETMPDVNSYFEALGPVWAPVLLTLSSLVALCVILLFLDTLRHVLRQNRPALRSDTIVVISVYPIIALCCVATLAVPRALLLAEAVSQIAFMIAAQRFFWLLLGYCNNISYSNNSDIATGQHNGSVIIKNNDTLHLGNGDGTLSSINNGTIIPTVGTAAIVHCPAQELSPEQRLLHLVRERELRLSLTTPPCCCWPCCSKLLPDRPLTESHIKSLSYLVLQLPIVQSLIYMILLIIWAENETTFTANYPYIQPFVVLSIIVGIWGITMTLRLVSNVLPARPARSRFLVLQLVLICAKLQGLAVKVAGWSGALPCSPPLTPPVVGNLIQNSALLCELLLLAVWARHIYKTPLQMEDDSSLNGSSINDHHNNGSIEKDNNNMAGRLGHPPLAWGGVGHQMKVDNAYVIENQYGDHRLGNNGVVPATDNRMMKKQPQTAFKRENMHI